MAIFSSFLYVYQRLFIGRPQICHARGPDSARFPKEDLKEEVDRPSTAPATREALGRRLGSTVARSDIPSTYHPHTIHLLPWKKQYCISIRKAWICHPHANCAARLLDPCRFCEDHPQDMSCRCHPRQLLHYFG